MWKELTEPNVASHNQSQQRKAAVVTQEVHHQVQPIRTWKEATPSNPTPCYALKVSAEGSKSISVLPLLTWTQPLPIMLHEIRISSTQTLWCSKWRSVYSFLVFSFFHYRKENERTAESMTVSHRIVWRKPREHRAQCAVCGLACGVMMLGGAFGDPGGEWERRLSSDRSYSQLPLEPAQALFLHPFFYLPAPLSWSPSLNGHRQPEEWQRAYQRRSKRQQRNLLVTATAAVGLIQTCVRRETNRGV